MTTPHPTDIGCADESHGRRAIMTQGRTTILFAGGGTGGHLFPGIAVAERLTAPAAAHFACSDRPLDAQILTKAAVAFTPLPGKPLPSRPGQVLPFLRCYMASKRMAKRLIAERGVGAVVAMGGFVCGPVVAAARAMRIPVVMVNLDAVPGKANRWLAPKCDHVLSVYATDAIKVERVIGLPLRKSSLSPGDAGEARRQLGMNPAKDMLLITGASQGAESINGALAELVGRADFRAALDGWQMLHLAGEGRTESVERAYREHGVDAKVVAFCHQMGAAWGGASIAISRSGAGSVAEAAANGTPTIFLPYPYHKDQHQKLNARPLVEAGGAIMLDDTKDPAANAKLLYEPLTQLMHDAAKRRRMREALIQHGGGDGALTVAELAMKLCQAC